MNSHEIQPGMIEILIFNENYDRWIWPDTKGSGHESAVIFVDFLRCRAMFDHYMIRRAVSLKSNTMSRTNWRTIML